MVDLGEYEGQSEVWVVEEETSIRFAPERLASVSNEHATTEMVAGMLTDLTTEVDKHIEGARLYEEATHTEQEWKSREIITTIVSFTGTVLDRWAPRADGAQWGAWYWDEYLKIDEMRRCSSLLIK